MRVGLLVVSFGGLFSDFFYGFVGMESYIG